MDKDFVEIEGVKRKIDGTVSTADLTDRMDEIERKDTMFSKEGKLCIYLDGKVLSVTHRGKWVDRNSKPTDRGESNG